LEESRAFCFFSVDFWPCLGYSIPMKNKSNILIVVAVLLCSLAVALNAAGSASHPGKSEDFKGSPVYDKLDLRFKQAWEESIAKGGDPDKSLECMMKLAAKPTDDERALLSAAGFKSRTVVGTIVTGNLAAKSVPEVAALPFVQAMELAVPMSIKKRGTR